MIYLIPFSLLVLLVMLFFARQMPLSETVTQWFWISLFLITFSTLIRKISTSMNMSFIKKAVLFKDYYTPKTIKMCLSIVSVIVLLSSALNSVYYFGGDDTRLFFLYPNEYFNNFVSKLAGDNSLSNIGNFLPATSISFFVILLSAFHSFLPFVNLQAVFYTANIILGVYFFYLLVKYIIRDSENSTAISVICSFLYVFSIFNFYTLYNSRLIAVFLISIYPLTIYLFLRSVHEKKIYFLAIIALVLSVFSVISVSSIWYVASIIAISPLLFYLLLPRWKTTIVYIGIMIIFTLLLNFHWLYYLPHTTLASKAVSATNSLVSEEFLNTNAEGVRSTSEINSLFYPFLNSYHRQIQLNFNWPYKPIYESWYVKLLPFNIVVIGIIFVAGYLVRKKDKQFMLYVAASTGLLLSLYLFTVNIGVFSFGRLGIEFFIWMVNHVPGFVVFRNMYDKFGHAMSISLAVLLAISLSIFFTRIQSKSKKIILIALTAITLLNAKPFLFHEFDAIPIWTTSHLFQGTTELNHDYKNLVEFVKNQDYRGRYGVLPMSGGNVIPIRDESLSNHYYVGVSPLLILSGKNDFSGFLSFGPYQEKMHDAVYKGDVEMVGQIFQRTNTKYIIVNNDIPAELQNSYMYPDGLYYMQDTAFIREFLGNKIADFGTSYTLYEINNKYNSEKIIVSDSLEEKYVNKPVSYQKASSHEYIVKIDHIDDSKYITFHEQNDYGWKLRTFDNNEGVGERITATEPYNNTWKIDPEEIKRNLSPSMYETNADGSLTITLRVFFEPYRTYYPLLIFSASIYILLTMYVLYEIYKERKKI